tara:strand:+ start:897 stop:1160 length:264 start_codon:yes stop_codon:yes gene_type:complete
MATLSDLIGLYHEEQTVIKLLGCTAGWNTEWQGAFRKVGQTMMEEMGLDEESMKALPETTELGPKAMEAYEELVALLKERGHLQYSV